jgi:hypothetical protein
MNLGTGESAHQGKIHLWRSCRSTEIVVTVINNPVALPSSNQWPPALIVPRN